MPATNIKTHWVSGNLHFTDKSGNDLISLQSGDHLLLNTYESTKTVRINSRTYASAASIIGLQTKPRAGIDITDDIVGMESMPGLNATFDGKGIKCFKAEPYWGSTAGTLSEDAIGLEATLGHPSGAGTVTGTVSVIKCINNCAGTITGGVYGFYFGTAGDNQAWSGFAVFPDDGQIANDAEDKSAGQKGWIKVLIGSSVRYIQAYAGA